MPIALVGGAVLFESSDDLDEDFQEESNTPVTGHIDVAVERSGKVLQVLTGGLTPQDPQKRALADMQSACRSDTRSLPPLRKKVEGKKTTPTRERGSRDLDGGRKSGRVVLQPLLERAKKLTGSVPEAITKMLAMGKEMKAKRGRSRGQAG